MKDYLTIPGMACENYGFEEEGGSTPEKLLIAAVLGRAFMDLNDKEERSSALHWFLGKENSSTDSGFSFQFCRSILALNPRYIQAISERVKEALSGAPTRQELHGLRIQVFRRVGTWR